MTARVAVVGGGIVGTAVALAAVGRGHAVVQLERDVEPRGASVRNFGLVWICGRAGGRELELALRGRQLWAELADRAGICFRPLGCLLVARDDTELALIEAACSRDDAGERGFRLLHPDEVTRVDGRLACAFGALHSPLDAVVEPTAVLAALRALASASGRYSFLPGRLVVEIDGAATDHRGEHHEADLVILCPGTSTELIPDEVAERTRLRRRNLQMLEVGPLTPPLPVAVADGDALRYYPVFDLPERAALSRPAPVVETFGAQLLVAPRLDGRLTIGDTHVDDQAGAFGSDEEADEHLLTSASEILGGTVLQVRRRWRGSYLRRTDERDCVVIESTQNGALLVGAAGGMGMTAAHAIAEEALGKVGL